MMALKRRLMLVKLSLSSSYYYLKDGNIKGPKIEKASPMKQCIFDASGNIRY